MQGVWKGKKRVLFGRDRYPEGYRGEVGSHGWVVTVVYIGVSEARRDAGNRLEMIMSPRMIFTYAAVR